MLIWSELKCYKKFSSWLRDFTSAFSLRVDVDETEIEIIVRKFHVCIKFQFHHHDERSKEISVTRFSASTPASVICTYAIDGVRSYRSNPFRPGRTRVLI